MHADHVWEKVVFDPWQQQTWDGNDTVLLGDPDADDDLGPRFKLLAPTDYLPTWYAARSDGGRGAREQRAARLTAVHGGTPTTVHSRRARSHRS